MAKLTFLGHAAFLLETGGETIVVDPFLTGNPVAKATPDEIVCNYVLLTHGHGDHVGDTVQIAKKNNATVIANYEIATWCGTQGITAHPMHIGGSHDFSFGKVKLTIAHHGSGLQTDDGFLYMGNPAGALFYVENKVIYHAGDTGLFYDMKLIGEMNDIDVALLPIGDNFTMGIDDAVKAAQFLQPKKVVPMHYNTFDVINTDAHDFAKKVTDQGGRVEILQVGDSLDV
jgi:L-ascorbate metabolism protein UlaG (beta-lactamase superfamily)